MVNEFMNRDEKTPVKVLGHSAPNPRMTLSAAALLACALSVPVFIVLTLVDWLFL